MSHPTGTPAPARAFAVVHIAEAEAQHLVKSPLLSEAAPARPSLLTYVQHPALIVLCVLMYLASVLWFVVTSGRGERDSAEPLESASSTPYVWLVCIPYTMLMIHKLLTTVRAMEAAQQPDEQALRELEEDNSECDDLEFGDDASHDAIAVIGDVCIYVIGILLMCFFVLPWQVYVE